MAIHLFSRLIVRGEFRKCRAVIFALGRITSEAETITLAEIDYESVLTNKILFFIGDRAKSPFLFHLLCSDQCGLRALLQGKIEVFLIAARNKNLYIIKLLRVGKEIFARPQKSPMADRIVANHD